MSILIRALCTTSLAAVTPDELRRGIVARLPALAAYYGEDAVGVTAARVQIEDVSPERPFEVYAIHYRKEDEERRLRVERRHDVERVREEVLELVSELADSEEDG